jgi:hypothetical protein
MSLRDQQRLRAIFVTKEAQSWSRLEKKKYVDEILIHKLFKHLNKSQVKCRLNLFCSEVFLRKKYGTLFFKNTIKMKGIKGKEKFIPRNILGILKGWREFFTKINYYNSLPDHLDNFLLRCMEAFENWSPEEKDKDLKSVLSKHDMARVESFMEYIENILIPSYAKPREII